MYFAKLIIFSAIVILPSAFFSQNNIIPLKNSFKNAPKLPLVTFYKAIFKDGDNNSLIEIIDEGSAGSLLINSLSVTPSATFNKLYNIGSNLYWNGSRIGLTNNAAGWISTNTKIHLEDNLVEVGIGTNSPSDKLHVVSEPGQNPLRVQVNGATKLRVLANGGTSIGSNNETPPDNGLYVHGDIKVNGSFTVGAISTPISSIVKLSSVTNSFDNINFQPYPSGFTWLNTHVLALKIRDNLGNYKAISMDANDAFSVTLKLSNIEIIVPNSDLRNKQYQIVLMKMD